MDKKLVSYISASYPDVAFSKELILALKENGTDIVELGVPFSDPVADGPVIERANQLSLERGFKIKDIFDISSAVASEIPLLWMGYFNSFYHYGFEEFMKKAVETKTEGFIIPDLPFEEAQSYTDLLKSYNLTSINFVAPTDTKERIAQVLVNPSKFIYMVAYAGITGSGASEDLSSVIANIREASDSPLYIGFGVDENSAKEKAKDVDGVIVGSAFIKHLIDDSLSNGEKLKKITELSKVIKDKINS